MIQHACPKCGQLSDQHYCEAHRDKPWSRSTRNTKTRSGWAQQRRARQVINRDQAICHVCRLPDATEADHIVPLAQGGADTIENMAPIHHHCHKTKTHTESRHPGGEPRPLEARDHRGHVRRAPGKVRG